MTTPAPEDPLVRGAETTVAAGLREMSAADGAAPEGWTVSKACEHPVVVSTEEQAAWCLIGVASDGKVALDLWSRIGGVSTWGAHDPEGVPSFPNVVPAESTLEECVARAASRVAAERFAAAHRMDRVRGLAARAPRLDDDP